MKRTHVAENAREAADAILLVDVMNLVFRSHYAHAELRSDGYSTGATYGFLMAVADLQRNISRRMLFCWDHGIPIPGARRPTNWRDSILPVYKASRPPNPAYPLITPQMLPLARALACLGYTNAAVMGLEADDLIGLLTTQLHDERILIYSTDRDLYQLLSADGRVQVLRPKKERGAFQWVTSLDVEREYGIRCKDWAAYLALGGDSSDNIKPRRGMGPKTAIKLVQAGARPGLPYATQPAGFRAKFGAYESCWEAVRASYEVARIPVSWTDPRIEKYLPIQHSLPFAVRPNQYWESPAARRSAEAEFLSFCANLEMTTLISRKREFFKPVEEKRALHAPQTQHRHRRATPATDPWAN